MKWSEDDAKFRRLLIAGYRWQGLPFSFLVASGLDVSMPALSVRDSIHEADQWLETSDLVVTKGGKEFIVQVKTRPFYFTDKLSWPRQKLPAFVDTTKKWNAQSVKPFAYVFVSEQTGGMVATCATEAARQRWKTLRRMDSVRGFKEEFYAVGREHLKPMSELVDAIKKAAGSRTNT